MPMRRFAQALLWLLLAAAFAFSALHRTAGADLHLRGANSRSGEDPRAWSYEVGRPVRSPSGYVEFIPGDAPVIVSAPHGGLLEPAEIPDRRGVSDRDIATDELARLFAEEFHRATGMRPHLVINLLHRRKLDANRPAEEAAEGDPVALEAWTEFHRFIEEAKAYALEQFGWGFYIDLHGHSHDHGRVELGYALSAEALRLSDDQLDRHVLESTLKPVCPAPGEQGGLAALLRGPRSLGTLLEARGVPSVPSSKAPAPLAGWAYFSGGYNVERHGALGGGTVHGVQVEVSRDWRTSPAGLSSFARAFAGALAEFLDEVFAPCRYLRIRSAETGAVLQSLALPAGGRRVEVYVDGRLVYKGEIPEAVTLSTSDLAQGLHEIAAVTTGRGEEAVRVEAPVLIRHFTLEVAGARLAQEAGAPWVARGSLEVELRPEHPHLSGVVVELRSLTPGGAPVELARAERLPVRLTVDTLTFEDGVYELAARAVTSQDVQVAEAVTLVFDNWEVLEDELLPPAESAWFGAQSRLKAVSSSGQWEYATGEPELFSGDDSRLVPASGEVHHLVWRLPGLDSVEVMLYTSVHLEGRVSLEASSDAVSWSPLSYEVVSLEGKAAPWSRVQMRAGAGGSYEYVRLTIDAVDLPEGALQLGRVRLTSLRG